MEKYHILYCLDWPTYVICLVNYDLCLCLHIQHDLSIQPPLSLPLYIMFVILLCLFCMSFLLRRMAFLLRRMSFLLRRMFFLLRRISFLLRRMSFLLRHIRFDLKCLLFSLLTSLPCPNLVTTSSFSFWFSISDRAPPFTDYIYILNTII